jgi:serine/threonine protein kinase
MAAPRKPGKGDPQLLGDYQDPALAALEPTRDPDMPPAPAADPGPPEPDEDPSDSVIRRLPSPVAAPDPVPLSAIPMAPMPPAVPPTVDPILDLGPGGRYELLNPLASGGMAQVFAARRHGAAGFERLVAIKIIRSERSSDPQFQKMFLQEAKIASDLHHRNICQVHDLYAQNDRYYLVMEYVPGLTLRDALKLAAQKGRTFSTGFACYVGAELADALHYAHSAKTNTGKPLGIVHRDVTPSNIMIANQGDVKLLDFGIAYSLLEDREHTAVNSLKGKYAYMSPEQTRTSHVDSRSDLFSLCTCLVEILSGKAPFGSDATVVTLSTIAAADPALIASAIHTLPQSLQLIFRTGLAQKPDERYQTGNELARALRSFMMTSGLVYGSTDAVAELEQLKAMPDHQAEATRITAAPQLAPLPPPPSPIQISDPPSQITPAAPTGPASPSNTEIRRRDEIHRRLQNPESPKRKLLVPAILIGSVLIIGNLAVTAFLKLQAPTAPRQVVEVKTETQQRAEREAQEKQILPPETTVPLAPRAEAPVALAPPPEAAPPAAAAPATAPRTPRRTTVVAAAPPPPAEPPPPPLRRRSLDSSTITAMPAARGAAPLALPQGTLIAARLSVAADPSLPSSLSATVAADVAGPSGTAIPAGATLICSTQGVQAGRLTGHCTSLQLATGTFSFSGHIVGTDNRPGFAVSGAAAPTGRGGAIAKNAAGDFATRTVNRIVGADVAGDAASTAAGAGREALRDPGSSYGSTSYDLVPKGTRFTVFVDSFGGSR